MLLMIVHLVFIAFNHRANLLPVEYLKMDSDDNLVTFFISLN